MMPLMEAISFGRLLVVLAGVVLPVSLACGCSGGDLEHELAVKVESLATVEGNLAATYGAVYVWDWQDLGRHPRVIPSRGEPLVRTMKGDIVVHVARSKRPGAMASVVREHARGQQPDKMWVVGRTWVPDALCVSRNGRYAALSLKEAAIMELVGPGWPRSRLGVLGVDAEAPTWVATIEYQRSGPTVCDVAVSEDGRYVAAVGTNDGGWVRVIDVGAKSQVWEAMPEMTTAFTGVAFSPDSRVLYAGDGGMGDVYVFDVASGKVLSKWPIHPDKYVYGQGITRLALSADGRHLGCGTSPRGEVFVWDARTGARVATIKTGQGTTRGLAFSPDGALLATCGWKGSTIRVWRMPPAAAEGKP